MLNEVCQNILEKISYYKQHLRNMFVYFNQTVIKIYQAMLQDPKFQSHMQEIEELENFKSHLSKIPVNIMLLEEFLKKGDQCIFLTDLKTAFNSQIPQDVKFDDNQINLSILIENRKKMENNFNEPQFNSIQSN